MSHTSIIPSRNPVLCSALVALGWATLRYFFSSIPLSEVFFETLEIVGAYLAVDKGLRRKRHALPAAADPAIPAHC